MFSWINDRFAQISNNSYKSRVTAVSLIFQCKTLVEINFSTKSKWKDHKKNVQNLLNYLFGEKIENFIFEDIKDSFINFFEYQAVQFTAGFPLRSHSTGSYRSNTGSMEDTEI